jgi:hypothetical protein
VVGAERSVYARRSPACSHNTERNGTRPRLSLTYDKGRRRTWRGARRPSLMDTQLAL